MHAIHKLNSRQVADLIRTAADGRWGDGAGLYLQIRFGTPSWVFRDYVDGGRERWTGLGSARFVSLADARRGAIQNRNLKNSGQDHRVERTLRHQAADRQAVTFADLVERFVDAKDDQFKHGGAKWRGPLVTHALPILGKMPVTLIDTKQVLRVLQPIWGTAIGEHVRQRLSAVLDFATAQEFRRGDNPARWKGHLNHILSTRTVAKHHTAMAIDALPEFMCKLRARDDIKSRALEFLILTAARSSEVTDADWSEIDLDAKRWTIPAERMKTATEHRVPLSDRAVELLRAQGPKATGLVFVSARHRQVIDKNGLRLLLQKSFGLDVKPHGFRSTFRDWVAERTNYPRELAEKALSHKIGSVIERAYQRSDLVEKRRALMADWASFCGGDNVVSLSAAA